MENKILCIEKQNAFKSSLPNILIDERIFKAYNIITFDINWINEKGEKCFNKGYRVQWNNLNGPYKGGLRFHKDVNLELFKNLAFEQTLKNILTGLPMGGAKGGSDFDPHNKSEKDIQLFCEAFMKCLYPYIGVNKDIPAGDIGVGSNEIKYLYLAYKTYSNKSDCALTGKPIELNGSYIRKEATGYGLCYITNRMLRKIKNTSFKDKKVVISGSGNVALYAAKKAVELGAKVVAMSDSTSAIYNLDGLDIDQVIDIKENKKGRIKDYLLSFKAVEIPFKDIWKVKADIYLPCATQDEITLKEAISIVSNHPLALAEGSNMATNMEAVQYFLNHNILYLPGKASNAGGVSVSGFEIIQNTLNEHWSKEKVDNKLKEVMETIFDNIYEAQKEKGYEINFLFGANYYSYKKLISLYNKIK